MLTDGRSTGMALLSVPAVKNAGARMPSARNVRQSRKLQWAGRTGAARCWGLDRVRPRAADHGVAAGGGLPSGRPSCPVVPQSQRFHPTGAVIRPPESTLEQAVAAPVG
jgi:hypothetical protein